MFKPANPHGERNPFTNIMKQPNKIPNKGLKRKPAENVKSEVNSTFGGLGDNWIAKHKATKTLINAINGVFFRGLCIFGWIIHPTYKFYFVIQRIKQSE